MRGWHGCANGFSDFLIYIERSQQAGGAGRSPKHYLFFMPSLHLAP
jgi:hypothetical protein